MENLKRKRERSFEYTDKSILLDIITEHFDVIESKKTDGVSVKLKNAEWQKIAEQFTAASSTYSRDSNSLKTLWENLKRKAKSAIAVQADNHYGTAGGKAKKTLNDPIVDIVVGLIRPHVEPFNNSFDDNNLPDTIVKGTSLFDNITEEDATEEIVINKLKNDWSEYNPTMLKSSMSAALRQPPLSTVHTSTSTTTPTTCTNYLLDMKTLEDMKSTASSTPDKPKVVTTTNVDKKDSSRRRPVLTTSASQTLLEARIKSLNTASMDAREEHVLQMKILEEKLIQEKIKTELLKLQMQREAGIEWELVDINETH